MRICGTEDVLSDPRWFPIWDVIALMVEDGRHAFDPASLLDFMKCPWTLSRPRDLQDLIRLSSISKSHDKHSNKSLVVIDGMCRRGGVEDLTRSEVRLHPLDAIAFLAGPFHVVVENEFFDGAFLLWMAKAVGFQKLIDAYRHGYFVFRHAGGKGALPTCSRVLSEGVWPRRDGSYRFARKLWVCAIFDNDAKHPSDSPNGDIKNSTEPHVVFIHMLQKRSIENYIPPKFLERFDPSRSNLRRIDAYVRMSEEQRAHYSMKTGFRVAGSVATKSDFMASNTISAEEKSCFASISTVDWLELNGGFGKSLSEIFVQERFRPNLNENYFSDISAKAEMISLCKRVYERL